MDDSAEQFKDHAQKSMFDFSTMDKTSLHVLEGVALTKVLDDVILIEFNDEVGDGLVMRGGFLVPISHSAKAWRTGIVKLAGHKVKEVKVGDLVIFPNNLGVILNDININVNGEGYVIPKGIFLNESRIFGIGKNLVEVKKDEVIYNRSDILNGASAYHK